MAILTNLLVKARYAKISPYIKGDVLELGCHDAKVLQIYQDRINLYYGIDRAQKRIDMLSKLYPDAYFVQRDLDKDRLALNRKFECILMIALIEHLFNQKFVMDEVASLLKPEGIIVITTPTPFGNDIVHRFGAILGFFAKHAVDDHIVVYNKHRFKILAKEIGLKLLHYKTFQFRCNQLVVFGKA